MVLDLGSSLFGDNNYMAENLTTFVVPIEQGGMTLIYPQGEASDLTGINGLTIAGTASPETQKTRGYRVTVKLFNAEGSARTFGYSIAASGTLLPPFSSPTSESTGVIANNAQYTKTWFFEVDSITPGEYIQFTMNGDILGTAAAAKYSTFLELKVETIQERRNEIN